MKFFRIENEIQDKNLEYEEKLRDIERTRQEERLKLEEEYYDKTKEVNISWPKILKHLPMRMIAHLNRVLTHYILHMDYLIQLRNLNISVVSNWLIILKNRMKLSINGRVVLVH